MPEPRRKPTLTARGSAKLLLVVIVLVRFSVAGSACLAQQKPPDEPAHELLVTDAGFIAIDSPKNWVRVQGRGLADFLPPNSDANHPAVRIYISAAAIGPNEDSKNADEYVESDIAGFRKAYPSATVERGEPLELPDAHQKAAVVTFRSGAEKNAIERVVYVNDGSRVILLVLSALDSAAFDSAVPTFTAFAKSYRGSLTPTTK